jgi:hypothetical protein
MVEREVRWKSDRDCRAMVGRVQHMVQLLLQDLRRVLQERAQARAGGQNSQGNRRGEVEWSFQNGL